VPAVEGISLSSRHQVWPSTRLSLGQDRTSPAQSTVTILVVDDEERVRRLTARMLRDEGYHVIEAGSAEQALDRLADAGEVQIVLADVAMPGGMSGLELAEKVLAAAPSSRIVLMSGYDRVFPNWESIGARFPLLMKPFTAGQLFQQMSDVLRGGLH
jgi:DNA-binding NtrC family response regulator